jgi:hypothetical protein
LTLAPELVLSRNLPMSSDEDHEGTLTSEDPWNSAAVVVNLDIQPVEVPENIPWVDPIHKAPLA